MKRATKTKTLAIAQQKGGTGKTTTALSIGAGLARLGRRVLLIDFDPQCNLIAVHTPVGQLPTVAQFLKTGDRNSITYPLPIQCACLIGDAALASSANLPGSDARHPELALRSRLRTVAGDFDCIIIDTPPGLGTLTVNALTAADGVIIPCLADAFSLAATRQIAKTIEAVRAFANPGLAITGLLLTRYNGRQVLSREIADELAETARQLGTRLFSTKIRECLALREAAAMGMDIFQYAPRSNGAKDYEQLVTEITTND